MASLESRDGALSGMVLRLPAVVSAMHAVADFGGGVASLGSGRPLFYRGSHAPLREPFGEGGKVGVRGCPGYGRVADIPGQSVAGSMSGLSENISVQYTSLHEGRTRSRSSASAAPTG